MRAINNPVVKTILTPKILKLRLKQGGTKTQYLAGGVEINALNDLNEVVENGPNYDTNLGPIIQDAGAYRITVKLTFSDTTDEVELLVKSGPNLETVSKAVKPAGTNTVILNDVLTGLKRNDRVRLVVKNNASSNVKTLVDDKLLNYFILEKL